MTDVSAYNALNTALFNTLSGGTALVSALGGTAIYYGQAPDKAQLPYVIWSYEASGVDNITPSESTQQLVYIRAYTETAKAAGEIDGKVCDLLHKQTLSITGWSNFWLARETEIALPDVDSAGNTIWSMGAFYRVRLNKS
jgi:hypothetical protein